MKLRKALHKGLHGWE